MKKAASRLALAGGSSRRRLRRAGLAFAPCPRARRSQRDRVSSTQPCNERSPVAACVLRPVEHHARRSTPGGSVALFSRVGYRREPTVESNLEAGQFREQLIIAPQRWLQTGLLMVVIGLPGFVGPLALAIAGRADWAGALACAALFGALIAVVANQAWAHPATIEVFERGLVIRRRGAHEFLPFSSLSVSAQTYNSWLTNKPSTVRYRIEMAGRRPVFVQQYQDNAAAVARLIELVPQRDLRTPLASVELLLSRMRRTVRSPFRGGARPCSLPCSGSASSAPLSSWEPRCATSSAADAPVCTASSWSTRTASPGPTSKAKSARSTERSTIDSAQDPSLLFSRSQLDVARRFTRSSSPDPRAGRRPRARGHARPWR